MEKPSITQDPESGLSYPTVFDPFMQSGGRYAVLVGGAGSGKSYTAAQKLVHRVLTEPGARFLVVRKVGATLRRSVFELFRTIISNLNYSKRFSFNITERRIECRENGAALLFTGIDDPEKIKSIQGISSVWVEEATELGEADFRQLELRVRGDTPGYKQFVLTCNPTSEQNWIFSRFCAPGLKVNDDLLVVNSTSYDNPYMDGDYDRLLQTANREDDNYFRVYTLGLWGMETSKSLFYKNFDAQRHVSPAREPVRELPLHLSFDFNVQPYITCTVWQSEGSRAWQIDELCLEGPRNTLPDMAEAIMRKFGRHWPGGVYLYGDPTGNNRHVAAMLTPFAQLKACLRDLEPQMRVARKAEGVSFRGLWLNRVFSSNYGGVQIEIAHTCKRTLDDYAHVMEAQDGTKVKPKVRDSNGVSYEPYGHCSDANDYFLCEMFKESVEAFKRGRV